jgi:hypothetical protein
MKSELLFWNLNIKCKMVRLLRPPSFLILNQKSGFPRWSLAMTVLALCFVFLVTGKSFAASQINKNLNLTVNNSHLLAFDEKIIRYKFENEKDFKAEILSNIFNTRQELLIKPLKKLDNNLTVWTESRVYNIRLEFGQKITGNESIIDKAPVLLENACGMTDFELDNPPKIEKTK